MSELRERIISTVPFFRREAPTAHWCVEVGRDREMWTMRTVHQ